MNIKLITLLFIMIRSNDGLTPYISFAVLDRGESEPITAQRPFVKSNFDSFDKPFNGTLTEKSKGTIKYNIGNCLKGKGVDFLLTAIFKPSMQPLNLHAYTIIDRLKSSNFNLDIKYKTKEGEEKKVVEMKSTYNFHAAVSFYIQIFIELEKKQWLITNRKNRKKFKNNYMKKVSTKNVTFLHDGTIINNESKEELSIYEGAMFVVDEIMQGQSNIHIFQSQEDFDQKIPDLSSKFESDYQEYVKRTGRNYLNIAPEEKKIEKSLPISSEKTEMCLSEAPDNGSISSLYNEEEIKGLINLIKEYLSKGLDIKNCKGYEKYRNLLFVYPKKEKALYLLLKVFPNFSDEINADICSDIERCNEDSANFPFNPMYLSLYDYLEIFKGIASISLYDYLEILKLKTPSIKGINRCEKFQEYNKLRIKKIEFLLIKKISEFPDVFQSMSSIRYEDMKKGRENLSSEEYFKSAKKKMEIHYRIYLDFSGKNSLTNTEHDDSEYNRRNLKKTDTESTDSKKEEIFQNSTFELIYPIAPFLPDGDELPPAATSSPKEKQLEKSLPETIEIPDSCYMSSFNEEEKEGLINLIKEYLSKGLDIKNCKGYEKYHSILHVYPKKDRDTYMKVVELLFLLKKAFPNISFYIIADISSDIKSCDEGNTNFPFYPIYLSLYDYLEILRCVYIDNAKLADIDNAKLADTSEHEVYFFTKIQKIEFLLMEKISEFSYIFQGKPNIKFEDMKSLFALSLSLAPEEYFIRAKKEMEKHYQEYLRNLANTKEETVSQLLAKSLLEVKKTLTDIDANEKEPITDEEGAPKKKVSFNPVVYCDDWTSQKLDGTKGLAKKITSKFDAVFTDKDESIPSFYIDPLYQEPYVPMQGDPDSFHEEKMEILKKLMHEREIYSLD